MAKRSTNYKGTPCQACGQSRFAGSTCIVCDDCAANHATPELLSVMSLFRNKSAPLGLMTCLNNALIADCTESRFRAAHGHISSTCQPQ